MELTIKGNKLMAYHFSKEICQISGFSIQIIAKLNGDGRFPNREVDPEVTKQRQNYETSIMCHLRTVYPYGLNDRYKVTDWTNKSENQNTSKTCFQTLKHIIPWKRRGKRRGKNQNVDVVWNKIVNSCTCQYKCMELIRYCRVQINSLSNKSNKNLATHVSNLLYSNNVDVPYNYLETIIDMINYKLNLAKPKNIQKTNL